MTTFEIVLLILVIVLLLISLGSLICLFTKKTNAGASIFDISELLHKNSKETSDDLFKFQEKVNEKLSTDTLEKNVTASLTKATNDQTKNFIDFQNSINKRVEDLDKSVLEIVKKSIADETANFMKFEDKILKNLNERLDSLDNKVNTRLDDGFKKTNETFQHIVERISRIDEAQKKIEQLSTNIVSLQDVLTDKKSRGTFGEVELRQIFSSVFGEANTKVFEMQFQLSTGVMADSVLHCPEPLGLLCIDSKFPLENYRRLVDKTITEAERNEASKAFDSDCKKHIDAIHDKYIIKNETADQAVLFLPSEAVFAELNAYHSNIVDYAYKKNVWITSPTTLMAFLTTIQVMLKNIERNKYNQIIQQELEKLSADFTRYKTRWDKLSKDISSVSKDVEDIHTTTGKISDRFTKISLVEFDTPIEIPVKKED